MDDGTAAMGLSALPAVKANRTRPDAMSEDEVTSRAPHDPDVAPDIALPEATAGEANSGTPGDDEPAVENQPPVDAGGEDEAPGLIAAVTAGAPDAAEDTSADSPRAAADDDLPPPSRETPPIRIVEALLFASDTPLSAGKLAEMVGDISVRDMRLLIADLNGRYVEAGMSFRIEKIAGGYQMLTRPEFQPWLARLVKHRSNMRLTEPALETLAVVAYKQPVIRADVEAIRGVACGEVLNRLRELGLIRIVGRAEVVGRPILYGTTRKFLDTFGLASLDELPPMEALVIKRPRQPEPDETESERPSRAAAGG